MAKSLKIILLFDLEIPPPENDDYSELMATEEWEGDRILFRTLKELGHEVTPFGIHNDLQPLMERIQRDRPDLVFNQCEALHSDRDHEPHIAAFLELLKIPYTGAGPIALQICKDKALTKKILSYHRVNVPRFVISSRKRPIRVLRGFHFPAFIKPLAREASEGIAQLSFAESEKDALERVKFLHESLSTDVIIEEYIEGREIYVGVLGNQRLTAFPPRELFFRDVPEGEPKFATFKAKWDDNYRKKWGIRSGAANSLPPPLDKQLPELCKKIYRLLQIQGYARVDLRLAADGKLYFIEANPNASIARDEDFAKSAEKAGWAYPQLIEQMIQLGLDR